MLDDHQATFGCGDGGDGDSLAVAIGAVIAAGA